MDLKYDDWVMSLKITCDFIVFGILLINCKYLVFDRDIESSQVNSIYYV